MKKIITGKNNVIAFNGQLLRYYLKDDGIVDMRKNQMGDPGYFIREKGLYVDVIEDLRSHKIEAVVFSKDHIRFYPEEKTHVLEEFGFKKVDLNHFRIFYYQKK